MDSHPTATDEITLTITRAEAGIVRVALSAHRSKLARTERNLNRKAERIPPERIEEMRGHNERDNELLNSVYRKLKRAMWGKTP